MLLSSARVGIVLTLIASGLRREGFVGIFPYASHCVIEAVGRVATPLPGIYARSATNRIVYHQWGIVQEQPAKNILIEDAVDTLCEPGTRLFPSGAQFEVWSLPKLIGCLSGGVVWCANSDLASRIRSLRDERKSGALFRWGIRVASQKFPALAPLYFGAESAGGPLPSFAIGDVISRITSWPDAVKERHLKLTMALPYAPDWFVPMSGRLPPVVPVKIDDETAHKLILEGVTSGFRHFERLGSNGGMFEKVFPIPIHQDMSVTKLKRILKLVSSSS